MEVVFATVLFLLAMGGLAVGLLLFGRPPRTACDGLSCDPDARCAGCPRRRAEPSADG